LGRARARRDAMKIMLLAPSSRLWRGVVGTTKNVLVTRDWTWHGTEAARQTRRYLHNNYFWKVRTSTIVSIISYWFNSRRTVPYNSSSFWNFGIRTRIIVRRIIWWDSVSQPPRSATTSNGKTELVLGCFAQTTIMKCPPPIST
jgi:hypothetical protein